MARIAVAVVAAALFIGGMGLLWAQTEAGGAGNATSRPAFDTIIDFAPVQVSAPQEQLWLKLDLETVPVGILVVDHVEEPTAN